jgi:hypothetical protein
LIAHSAQEDARRQQQQAGGRKYRLKNVNKESLWCYVVRESHIDVYAQTMHALPK